MNNGQCKKTYYMVFTNTIGYQISVLPGKESNFLIRVSDQIRVLLGRP